MAQSESRLPCRQCAWHQVGVRPSLDGTELGKWASARSGSKAGRTLDETGLESLDGTGLGMGMGRESELGRAGQS
jgi:hypothetical protein